MPKNPKLRDIKDIGDVIALLCVAGLHLPQDMTYEDFTQLTAGAAINYGIILQAHSDQFWGNAPKVIRGNLGSTPFARPKREMRNHLKQLVKPYMNN